MKRTLETRGDEEDGNTNSSSSPTNNTKKQRTNQLKCWFFTFNNYEEHHIGDLEIKFREICSKYIFETEVGESGTPHLQGTIWLKTRMRWEQFNLPRQIHWEKTRNEEAAANYCAKEGVRVFKWGFPHELKLIQELRPFQRDLVEISKQPPNDRKILYIWDPPGDKGKTQLVKYMVAKHNALFCTGGRYEDMAYIISSAHKAGRDLNAPWTFILNVPRDVDSDHISYKALEAIKDGLLTSPKYESTSLVFNSPHVWVLSNSAPRLDRLTADKWDIYTINIVNQLIPYDPNNTPRMDTKRESAVWELD